MKSVFILNGNVIETIDLPQSDSYKLSMGIIKDGKQTVQTKEFKFSKIENEVAYYESDI